MAPPHPTDEITWRWGRSRSFDRAVPLRSSHRVDLLVGDVDLHRLQLQPPHLGQGLGRASVTPLRSSHLMHGRWPLILSTRARGRESASTSPTAPSRAPARSARAAPRGARQARRRLRPPPQLARRAAPVASPSVAAPVATPSPASSRGPGRGRPGTGASRRGRRAPPAAHRSRSRQTRVARRHRDRLRTPGRSAPHRPRRPVPVCRPVGEDHGIGLGDEADPVRLRPASGPAHLRSQARTQSASTGQHPDVEGEHPVRRRAGVCPAPPGRTEAARRRCPLSPMRRHDCRETQPKTVPPRLQSAPIAYPQCGHERPRWWTGNPETPPYDGAPRTGRALINRLSVNPRAPWRAATGPPAWQC